MRKYFIIFILVIEIILVSLLIYVGVVYKNKKIISIAHRGETSRIIENTLPALEEAVKDSYNGIEIDVRRTSDGVIVLNHDKKISGTINGEVYTYNISKTPYEKLREIILMYDSEYGKTNCLLILIFSDGRYECSHCGAHTSLTFSFSFVKIWKVIKTVI